MYSVGLGRAMSMLAMHRADERTITVAAPVQKKATLDNVFDSTVKLIDSMENAKAHWEREIVNAQEQLRQVNVVLEGATSMLQTLKDGLQVTGKYDPLDDDDLVRMIVQP